MSKRKKDDQWVEGSGPAEGTTPSEEISPSIPLLEAEPESDPVPVAPTTPVGVPVRGEGMIRLEVFLRLAGKKADQMVPFARWARKQRLLPRPMGEWKALFTQFMNRPVTG